MRGQGREPRQDTRSGKFPSWAGSPQRTLGVSVESCTSGHSTWVLRKPDFSICKLPAATDRRLFLGAGWVGVFYQLCCAVCAQVHWCRWSQEKVFNVVGMATWAKPAEDREAVERECWRTPVPLRADAWYLRLLFWMLEPQRSHFNYSFLLSCLLKHYDLGSPILWHVWGDHPKNWNYLL